MTEGAFVAHHPSVKKPLNPWRMSRWTGISSSGAGCAVAAGMCTAALGTDTGGSIRFPSAACSLTSLKPTHGRVSLHGISPFAPSLDTVGPMARSVQDAATLYAVMAGRDSRDGWSFKAKVPAPELGPVKPKSRRVRIGIDKKFAGCIVDRDVMDVFRKLLSDLRDLDVQFFEIHLPDLSEVHPAWITIATSELALSHAATYPAQAEHYGPALRAAIENGLAQTGGQVARAWQVRGEWKSRLEACFEEIDVIISPDLPRPSRPRHGPARREDLPGCGDGRSSRDALQPVGLARPDASLRYRPGRHPRDDPARRPAERGGAPARPRPGLSELEQLARSASDPVPARVHPERSLPFRPADAFSLSRLLAQASARRRMRRLPTRR